MASSLGDSGLRAAAVPSGPRITIITVVRNGGELFTATVDSVAAQDYPSIEFIIIDGGSIDCTLEIIRANADRISAWKSEPDLGIADAFNKGIALATGDYLLFLNADDSLVAPDVITRIADAIVAGNFPELAYGDCRVVSRNTRKERYIARIVFDLGAFHRGAMLPHPSLFMHRSYFERFGCYDTSFLIAMDYEILLRGVDAIRVIHMPILVTEVSDGGASTRSGSLVISEIVRAMRLNGVLQSRLEEWCILVYFQSRRVARGALSWLGVYDWFSRWRDSRPVMPWWGR